MERKVSIIIPIYKVEQFINKCIDSIINQTYKNLQIILVNDGSPDNCPEICDEYAELDNRIEVIHKDNGGLSEARNVGIDIATGKYILFVDSDDYIENDAVEKLVDYAEKYEVEIVSANALKITGKEFEKLITLDIEKHKIMSGEQYMVYSIKNSNFAVAVCLRLYRTELIKDNKIYFVKGILHEDENWTPRIMLKAKRVIQVDYEFYNYIIREDSITQAKNKEKNILDILMICKELEELFNAEVSNDYNRKLFLDYLARIYMATSVFGKYDCSFYKSCIDKDFVYKNAFLLKTKIKATIYRISIPLYRYIKLRFD